MAIVPRCAWCARVKKDLGLVLLVVKKKKLERWFSTVGRTGKWVDDDNNELWTAHICMPCYEQLGGSFNVLVPPSQNLLGEVKEKEDELSERLQTDIAMLRLSPPNKHIQGIGIRVNDEYEVVLLED